MHKSEQFHEKTVFGLEMMRKKTARMNLIALLLMMGAWWFSIAILAGIPWHATALVIPVLLAMVSIALLIYSLARSIPGPVILAGGLFAVSILLALQVIGGAGQVWLLGWPFILMLAGLGILVH